MQDDTARGRSGADVSWTVCPITLSALALVADREIREILKDRARWQSTVTTFELPHSLSHHDTRHLWGAIREVTLRAWARGRLTADIAMASDSGVTARWVDQAFVGLNELPHTIQTALVGRPATAYVDHPVFEDAVFQAGATDRTATPVSSIHELWTPASTIPVDDALTSRIIERRDAMLARHPAPTNQEACA